VLHTPAHGLFVGLITLDLLYLVTELPDRNQKIVALDYLMAAGGPATNAAVAFKHLGNEATILGVMGDHAMTTCVAADLQQRGVTIADLQPNRADPLPTSSILVTEATGDRAVVSLNASKSQASADAIPGSILTDLEHRKIQIVLIDGHQMEVGHTIAQRARAAGIPIVIDGGSWKPGFEQVLPLSDYVICSANFHPPGCTTPEQVLHYLAALQIPHIAITQGDRPIQFLSQRKSGCIPVPSVPTIDTLGAGDIFHGAFCHFILHASFQDALAQAATIAAHSCQFFGTRRWMEQDG
jgi:sugar/nucleoside kinase (ribokinase family)